MSPRRQPALTSLRDLHREPGWLWLYCEGRGCGNRKPVALAPFVIRWGPNESSDRLRGAVVCSECGHRGAAIRMPSWVDINRRWGPFPVDYPPPR